MAGCFILTQFGRSILAKSSKIRGGSSSAYPAQDIDAAIKSLRLLWKKVEKAQGVDQSKLKREMLETVGRLRNRIEAQLKRNLSYSTEPSLFPLAPGEPIPALLEDQSGFIADRFPKPILRSYNKDLTDHALKHLPHLTGFSDKEQIRRYLTEKIRFNSLATRRRAANYLINRFFPCSTINNELPRFAAATAGKPSLSEALFYLTCRSELIVALAAEDVVYPSLAQGGIARNRILEFVQSKFKNSKSIQDISQALIRTYERFGIATANRTTLNVSLREGSTEAFAYVLHLEFPEPGMYSFESILSGPMHKWMLWDRDWMVSQLYHLRERGLLVKVSEIDRMRQFTTKFSLCDAIEPIVALAKESVQ
jgi:hypothetical protein